MILFITLIIFSCTNKEEKWRGVEIQPIDKSQIITIITIKNQRYIMDGKVSQIPQDGYILLDIAEVDALGDAISVCWNDSGYKWKISSTYARLIENKLDTSKFFYYQPIGKYGEPTSNGYLENNCGEIMIREHLTPRGNVKLNYITNLSGFNFD